MELKPTFRTTFRWSMGGGVKSLKYHLKRIGSSLVAVPDLDYIEIPMNRLSQWQLVHRMNQHFWRKWSSEYLNRLQQRPKWCKGNVGFKEGDLVISQPSREFR
ncbi:integrase catalytic domain-containing protein [Trichonephila clavipes]|nr:integrase catalytic domain-containing protein [Trichonephila clavipes]